jgi:hypothetical protein
VIIQQGLKYLNKLFFGDIGVKKAELQEVQPEIINPSPLDTGEPKPFTPRILRPRKEWKKIPTEEQSDLSPNEHQL